jgi:hypothetical protein
MAATTFIAIGAIATAATAVSALWLQWLRDYARRPRLELHFDQALTEEYYSITSTAANKALWVRCSVTNSGRAFTAENAEVWLILGKLPHSKSGSLLPSRTFAWADISTGTTSIPAGVTRYVDLVGVKIQNDNVRRDLRMRLMLFPWQSSDPDDDPNDDRHMLPKGTYPLLVALSAQNVPAKLYDLTIEFDGSQATEPRDLIKAIKIDLKRHKPVDATWDGQGGLGL